MMRPVYRKSYEVVGYVGDACMICIDCAPPRPELPPVFLGDTTHDDVCDVCFQRLDGSPEEAN